MSLDQLTDRQLIGQLLCPALFGDKLESAGEESLRTYPPGSFIVFGRSARLAAIQDLIERHARELPLAPVVFSDMERGAGQQVSDLTMLPPPLAIAAAGSLTFARQAGSLTASEARRAGIKGLFAPVADVNVEPENPIIGTRAFGDRPEQVAAYARAFVEGVHGAGGFAVAKHFPGHGDTKVDSHLGLPRVNAGRETMERVHLPPFRACIEAGVDGIMVGHLACPALGTAPDEPASQSRVVIEELLRRQLAFDGLVVTDALNMAGATEGASDVAALRSLEAGADVLLMPANYRAAAVTVKNALREGRVTRARLMRSARRLHAWREERAASMVDTEATLAREIAESSITAPGGPTPEPFPPGTRVAVQVIDEAGENELFPALRNELEASGWRFVASREGTCRVLVVLTRPRAWHGVASLAAEATQEGLRFLLGATRRLVLGIGGPWFLRPFLEVSGAFLSYGSDPESLRALARVASGSLPARGRLPVSMPR
ncbi:MAG: glycoside hydrolase family 3 N-terminal domain-containing protein [Planctomycetota bacterium]